MSKENTCETTNSLDSCGHEVVTKVYTGKDAVPCGWKYNDKPCHPAARLPDGRQSITEGEACTTEPCPEVPVCDPDDLPEACDYEGKIKVEEVGCEWLPTVCIPSIPPAIGCAPVEVGIGSYSGGVPHWTGNCMEDCDTAIMKELNPNFKTYLQGNWEHVLDLATHPERHTALSVIGEGTPRPINEQEWHALAYKLGRSGIVTGAFREYVNMTDLGMAYVKLGDDTYGLSTTVAGCAVGTPLKLVSILNDAGDVIGLGFPVPTS